MNDFQKLQHNLIEALKPLNNAIDQICAVAQKPVFDIPPDLFKDVNFKGAASMPDTSESGLANMIKDEGMRKKFEAWERKEFPHLFKPAPWDNDSLKIEPIQSDINPETTLLDLRPGAVFVTRDGTYAVKSEYRTGDLSQCECVLLESGEYAWFKDRDNTLVREVRVEGFRADD